MDFIKKVPFFNLKTGSVFGATALSILGLNACTPQTPVAIVEPSAPVVQPDTQANTTPESTTVKNLISAYNGESNAHVMYLAFAQKADGEGYKEVGSLFRATARAEAIHRDNHAQVIQAMGGTPKNNIATPVVNSTAANLTQALKGESYERDTMYPGFIKEAKQSGNKAAVQTFNYALEAETGHAKLYTTAKNNLASWKQADRPLYVCPVSGYTTLEANSKNCSQPFEKSI
ncbi:rubrerythrin family protein [Anabaena cylindrica UHCC 0172]|uniref:rubrerythrin family protein n=1 Tax=Anabaena cylindrica TaxID=1165 RepID=UPI002B200D36|nr:rubrerythrin family protein [Anabaena cylindrica]MEA5554576.1 rubrerythrin family protein [Anabaena cylindrica UHCC 0172]